MKIDDVYWRIKYGKSIKRLSALQLRHELDDYIKKPVFFLSTGRCGTKWFSHLLNNNKNLMVLHNPSPSLAVQSKLAYNTFNRNYSQSELEFLSEIFLTGREIQLRFSYKTGKRYVETNNYITFFAPALLKIFPDAKFVHLYRHPGEFVRSGIRRNYYTKDNYDDIKRPVDFSKIEKWENYSQIEKISWLWNETNLFIENFKSKHPDNVFSFNFNNKNVDNINEMLSFIGVNIDDKVIEKSLKKKANIQTSGNFPKYYEWQEEDKNELINICEVLAQKYGYNLEGRK